MYSIAAPQNPLEHARKRKRMPSDFLKQGSTKDKIQKTLWALVGTSIVIIIIYYSTTFDYPYKRTIIHTPLGDALVHILSFGLIMFCFCRSFKAKRTQIIIGSGLIALGMILEVLQVTLGNENIKFGFDDMIANTLGITIGVFLARLKK